MLKHLPLICLGSVRFFYDFGGKNSPAVYLSMLNLFDQNCNKNSNIVKYDYFIADYFQSSVPSVILQKSLYYADLVIMKHFLLSSMLKKVLLHNMLVEIMILFFYYYYFDG